MRSTLKIRVPTHVKTSLRQTDKKLWGNWIAAMMIAWLFT